MGGITVTFGGGTKKIASLPLGGYIWCEKRKKIRIVASRRQSRAKMSEAGDGEDDDDDDDSDV